MATQTDKFDIVGFEPKVLSTFSDLSYHCTNYFFLICRFFLFSIYSFVYTTINQCPVNHVLRGNEVVHSLAKLEQPNCLLF